MESSNSETINLAIFASGSGTNAENIYLFFKENLNYKITVKRIYTNNPEAGVIQRMLIHGIQTEIIDPKDENFEISLFESLKNNQIDYIILAGYLKLIPNWLILQFPEKIVNIHPALLPNYGGKGMYGIKVHQAVISNQEKESGITIHLVNEKYDEGKVLAQFKISIAPTDTSEDLAKKIHELEYIHYPEVIQQYILNKQKKETD